MRKALVTLLSLLLPTCGGCSSDHERLEENADTLTISIGLLPFGPGQKDPGGGLRSVLLYTSDTLIVESHTTGPDGKPGSADAKLAERQLRAVIEELKRLGVWEDADSYYSERIANPKSEPPPGNDYLTHRSLSVRPSCEIKAVYHEGDYYRYVVSSVPWGSQVGEILSGLRKHVPGPIPEQLIETYERFR